MKFRIRILILTIIILTAACVSVEVCEEEYASEMVASFKTMDGGTAADTTVNSLSLYGIREGRNDSLLYHDVSTSGFVIPLDPEQDFSSFVLQIDTLTDTLKVYYEHEIYMISYTCGFASLFTLDQLETRTGVIQNDTIINAMIDAEYEANEEHIWLYL
jgi:hypothetical protein